MRRTLLAADQVDTDAVKALELNEVLQPALDLVHARALWQQVTLVGNEDHGVAAHQVSHPGQEAA